MNLGLNWMHWIVSGWSDCRMATLWPFSAFHTWILPSDEPEKTNWESGENEASNGMFLIFVWPFYKNFRKLSKIEFLNYFKIRITVRVWRTFPWKASITLIIDPFVETRIYFPSGLNLSPVHSVSELESLPILKLENGPFSNERKS